MKAWAFLLYILFQVLVPERGKIKGCCKKPCHGINPKYIFIVVQDV